MTASTRLPCWMLQHLWTKGAGHISHCSDEAEGIFCIMGTLPEHIRACQCIKWEYEGAGDWQRTRERSREGSKYLQIWRNWKETSDTSRSSDNPPPWSPGCVTQLFLQNTNASLVRLLFPVWHRLISHHMPHRPVEFTTLMGLFFTWI